MNLVKRLVSPRELLHAKITRLSTSCHTAMLLAAFVFVAGCSSGGGDSGPAPAPDPSAFENRCVQNNIARFRLFNNGATANAVIRLLIDGAVVSVGGQEVRAAPGGFSELVEVAAGDDFVVTAQRVDNNNFLAPIPITAQPRCETFSVTYP